MRKQRIGKERRKQELTSARRRGLSSAYHRSQRKEWRREKKSRTMRSDVWPFYCPLPVAEYFRATSSTPPLFCTTLHHRPPCITVHIPRILHVQNVTPVETLFRAHTKTTRVQLVPFTDSLQALCCLTSRQTSSIDLSHRSDHIATTRQGWKAQGCHFVAWCHSKDGVTIT